MEIFKEVEILGKTFIKAKRGLRITKEEIEGSRTIAVNLVKGINKAADFVNENKLTKPLADFVKSLLKTIIVVCSILLGLSVLALVLIKNIFANLLIIASAIYFIKIVMFILIIIIIISFFFLYAKVREKIVKF